MKKIVLALAVCASPCFAQNDESTAPPISAVCDLAAVAFANPVFNTQQAAAAKCDELVNQAGGNCKVVRLNNGKRRAQFRKAFNLKQLGLQDLLAGLQNFILQSNLFSNAQIKLQAAVSDGCQ